MMKKRNCIAMIAALSLVSGVLVNGCGGKVEATDLMKGISGKSVEAVNDLDTDSIKIMDFAIRLLRESQNLSEDKTKENVLISPVSIMSALAMTANGANGDTLAQMEDVLGLKVDTLNADLHTYMKELPGSNSSKLHIANSIWFDDGQGFEVNEDFLQTNANYYDAQLYQTPFNQSALNAMNQWVNENTDGHIEKIVDKIPKDTVMYLLNALAFDAKWDENYKSSDVWPGTFYPEEEEDGKTVEYMSSKESVYLKDDLSKGFIKYYKNKKYAFVAILPNETLTVSDYLVQADGEQIYQLFDNAKTISVDAAMPKFELEYDTELSQLLKNMGMTDAFDKDTADFSGIGAGAEGNLYINRIIHKTFMVVDEKGTKAGAISGIESKVESAEYYEEFVHLNRPYIYMIIDCEHNLPIFMGTMMDVPN